LKNYFDIDQNLTLEEKLDRSMKRKIALISSATREFYLNINPQVTGNRQTNQSFVKSAMFRQLRSYDYEGIGLYDNKEDWQYWDLRYISFIVTEYDNKLVLANPKALSTAIAIGMMQVDSMIFIFIFGLFMLILGNGNSLSRFIWNLFTT